MVESKRDKLALDYNLNRTTFAIDKTIREDERQVSNKINAAWKELRFKSRRQQDEMAFYKSQVKVMENEDVEFQKALDECLKRINNLEFRIGKAKNNPSSDNGVQAEYENETYDDEEGDGDEYW